MYTQVEFRKLNIQKRHKELKQKGVYIAARRNGAYTVHLFTYNLLYVEVWILISLNTIQWIEIQENNAIIDAYANDIDLGKLL